MSSGAEHVGRSGGWSQPHLALAEQFSRGSSLVFSVSCCNKPPQARNLFPIVLAAVNPWPVTGLFLDFPSTLPWSFRMRCLQSGAQPRITAKFLIPKLVREEPGGLACQRQGRHLEGPVRTEPALALMDGM